MTTQPSDPNGNQEINREALERQLRDKLDKVVRETGRYVDHQDFVRKVQQGRSYQMIYNILSNFNVLDTSDDPFETQFAILENVLPQLLRRLNADTVILLNNQMPDKPELLQVFAHKTQLETAPSYANKHFMLIEDQWASLGNYKGVEVTVSLPSKKQDRPPYLLPLPSYDSEVVFIRVGLFDSASKFVLVIHKALDDTPVTSPNHKAETYAKDLHDLFGLLALRLQELNYFARYRQEEINYDNKRTEFMQDVLHQIRGSLSGLLMNLTYLQDLSAGTEMVSHVTALHQSMRVLSDAAESSYLATEKRSIFEVYPQPPKQLDGEDWVELLREYTGMFSGEALGRGLKGITLDESQIAQFPRIQVSVSLIKLVVFNLMQNALKYSQLHSNTAITIRGEVEGQFAKLVFTNVGLRLDDDEVDHIFERHYRSRHVLSRPGTGIGLFLCDQIMAEHGGEIRLEKHHPLSPSSDLSEFSFALYFPILLAETAPPALPDEANKKPTILYIEDKPYLHSYFILLLEKNFNVIHAHVGGQALNYLAEDRKTGKHNIRLILLDIWLENDKDKRFDGPRGGVELARVIRQQEQHQQPIIGWTGNNLIPEMVEELTQLGVKQVLNRTQISMKELTDLIEKTINPQ